MRVGPPSPLRPGGQSAATPCSGISRRSDSPPEQLESQGALSISRSGCYRHAKSSVRMSPFCWVLTLYS